MHPSKLGTMLAILVTVAGFSASAGSADAQISGTIGGDVVAHDPLPVAAYVNRVVVAVFNDFSMTILGTGIDASPSAWR